ncbi:DUF1534 domain-containing protein [Pseudomonas syringae]|nr:DUF1534 domain-containing protein [Pseudomonas syringae]
MTCWNLREPKTFRGITGTACLIVSGLSFLTLQRGNAVRDALRQLSAPLAPQ